MIRTVCFILVDLRLYHRSLFVIHMLFLHTVLSMPQSKICLLKLTLDSLKFFPLTPLDINLNFSSIGRQTFLYNNAFLQSQRLGGRVGDIFYLHCCLGKSLFPFLPLRTPDIYSMSHLTIPLRVIIYYCQHSLVSLPVFCYHFHYPCYHSQ